MLSLKKKGKMPVADPSSPPPFSMLLVGSMLTSFEAYAKRVNSDMAYMKSNLTALAEDNEDQDGKHDDLKRKYETMEYTTKTMKSDVTELTTKMYNLKTAIFEHNNELVTQFHEKFFLIN